MSCSQRSMQYSNVQNEELGSQQEPQKFVCTCSIVDNSLQNNPQNQLESKQQRRTGNNVSTIRINSICQEFDDDNKDPKSVKCKLGPPSNSILKQPQGTRRCNIGQPSKPSEQRKPPNQQTPANNEKSYQLQPNVQQIAPNIISPSKMSNNGNNSTESTTPMEPRKQKQIVPPYCYKDSSHSSLPNPQNVIPQNNSQTPLAQDYGEKSSVCSCSPTTVPSLPVISCTCTSCNELENGEDTRDPDLECESESYVSSPESEPCSSIPESHVSSPESEPCSSIPESNVTSPESEPCSSEPESQSESQSESNCQSSHELQNLKTEEAAKVNNGRGFCHQLTLRIYQQGGDNGDISVVEGTSDDSGNNDGANEVEQTEDLQETSNSNSSNKTAWQNLTINIVQTFSH